MVEEEKKKNLILFLPAKPPFGDSELFFSA